METRFGIRESGNLDSWKGTTESVKARIRIRGKERQDSWKQELELVGTNVWIDESGR